MRRIALMLLLALVSVPSGAVPKNCPASSLQDEVNRASLVFTGRVITVTEVPGSTGGIIWRRFRATFRVKESFKGSAKDGITLDLHSADVVHAPALLRSGREWLVFADGSADPGYTSVITPCSPTREVTAATHELKELRSHREKQ